MHVSVGNFPQYFLAPLWLDMFLEGGAITQDHFGASDFNLGILRERRVSDLFVLVRDPRAAARSQVHFRARDGRNSGESLTSRIERECFNHFIPWLNDWLACAKQSDLPFRVHWVTYREVRSSPAAVLRRMSRILVKAHPALAAYTECPQLEPVNVHLVTGDDHAWESEVDYQARERLWAACTPEIKSLLALKW
jgi:hypothetical protein